MRNKKILSLLAILPVIFASSSCGEQVDPLNTGSRKFYDQTEVNKLRDVIHSGEGQGYPAPSTGNTRVLVVPVEFKDYPADEIGQLYNSETSNSLAKKHYDEDGNPAGGDHGRGAENAKEDIRKVYFGESSETTWHSLSSYYKEASYGKLNFNGLVTDWFKVYTNPDTMEQVTAKEWAEKSSAQELASRILDYYTDPDLKKYKEFKNEDGTCMFNSGSEFLKYFDSNNDGCIDVLEMVYSAPYYATYTTSKGTEVAIDNEKFWAYCGGTTTDGDVNNPKLSKWAFQSYYTCVEGGTFDGDKWRAWTCKEIVDGVAKVDAHTIVHETGHALGLADYYDYDYKKSPMGGVDMMDHNVGDHSAYSKSVLGWTDPTYICGPTTVTINSFTKTGDCLIVPYYGYFGDNKENKYANTFMQEYLTIELYNSTGVNAADSEKAYAGRYPTCPKETGIKIFHVDSRLGVVDYSSGSAKFVNYTDSIVSVSSSSVVTFAHSNTGSKTIKSGDNYQWYIQYLPVTESNTSNTQISDKNLFHEGDTFGVNSYKDFTFHSGKKFGYKISIDKLSDDSATITFERA